jgi:predicted transcriptional regulator
MTIETDPSFIENRKWLEENRKHYLDTKQLFEDPERCRGLVMLIANASMPLFRFDAYKHNEAAAVQELATFREKFRPLLNDLQFIEDYEERQEQQIAAVRAAEDGQPEGKGVDSEDELG